MLTVDVGNLEPGLPLLLEVYLFGELQQWTEGPKTLTKYELP